MYPQVQLTNSISLWGRPNDGTGKQAGKAFFLFFKKKLFSYSLFSLGEVQGFEKEHGTSTEKKISMILQFPYRLSCIELQIQLEEIMGTAYDLSGQ